MLLDIVQFIFQGYCYACWKKHVNDDLREELNNISGDLEISTARFEEKIIYFRVIILVTSLSYKILIKNI